MATDSIEQAFAAGRIGLSIGGAFALPMPARGSIRFRAAAEPGLGVVCELNGPVLPPTGAGTHDIIERKGRESFTEYHGKGPMMLKVPLLLDKWTQGESVQPEIRMLERFHGIGVPGPPPQMIFEGYGIPHSHASDRKARWVFDGDPEWDGEDVRTIGDRGERSYIAVNVTILRVSTPDPVAAEDQPKAGTHRGGNIITVDKGDRANTLTELARKYKMTWRELRKLNPKLPADPDRKIPNGTRVRVS